MPYLGQIIVWQNISVCAGLQSGKRKTFLALIPSKSRRTSSRKYCSTMLRRRLTCRRVSRRFQKRWRWSNWSPRLPRCLSPRLPRTRHSTATWTWTLSSAWNSCQPLKSSSGFIWMSPSSSAALPSTT